MAAPQCASAAVSPPTGGALYSDGQAGRWLLGGSWLYRSDPTDAGIAGGWPRETATTGWTLATVPSVWNAGDFSDAGFSGSIGWYRRDFTVPAHAYPAYVAASARRWIVRFESVNFRAAVWLNGRLLGLHVGANLPFEFDLGSLKRGVNRLVVRVDNRVIPSGLPPPPGGGWWNYGGILREVYLRTAAAADLGQVRVRPTLPCPTCAATVDVQAAVRNVTGSPQTVRLQGTFGRQPLDLGTATIAPHQSWVAQTRIRVAHPRLWSIGHGILYATALTLTDKQGRKLGGFTVHTGIRSITVGSDGRMRLNGRPLSLRGVEFREQDIRQGGALDPAHLRQLVTWTQQLGASVIRSDAPDPLIAQLADQDGLLLWLDIPVNASVTDQYLQMPAWNAGARATLTDNILTNQNHASVLAWSIGNELPTPATNSETAYVAKMVALAHKLDPTRPVAMSISDWPGNPCQPAYAPLDAIGLNEYVGWYDAGGGTTDDRDALGPELDHLHSCYPHQSLFVTEFGFDATRNGPPEVRGTYQYQAGAAAYHLAVFAARAYLSGAMYFVLQDAVSTPGYTGGNPFPQPPLLQHGLLDYSGHRKPAWYAVSAIYHHTRQIAAALSGQ